MTEKEMMHIEIENDYFEKFKSTPPVLFGQKPNDKYYQLLFECLKRNKPVTPDELEEVFEIEDNQYDLINEFDPDDEENDYVTD